MKILRYILPILAGISIVSCDESLTDVNKDPNNATSADPKSTFTTSIAYYGLALDASFNATDVLFAQYWTGGPGVAITDPERYFFEANDFDAEWSNSYLQTLSDLDFTIKNGNRALSAAANVLTVMMFQNLVDHYGDIPYSEALKGDPADGNILTPKYDDAEGIYDDLIVRLDAAINVLSTTNDAIGPEDLIYGGDLNKWIRLANSVKLKMLMRQSITNPTKVSQDVIDLISTGVFIENEAGLARVPFTTSFNPMYIFSEAGVGQFFVASQTTIDVLEDLNDPRLSVLYDPSVNTGTVTGIRQGDVADLISPVPEDYSFPSNVAYGANNDVIFMSHWEVMFLRAEAAMRFNTADDERDMFEDAVTAHFNYIGATGVASYLADEIVYNPGSSLQVRSDKIAIQKWISMNGLQETEGYLESRRFDVPGSNIFTNMTNGILYTPTRSTLPDGVHPTIRLYPQTELSFNPNCPKGRVVTEKVFWDN